MVGDKGIFTYDKCLAIYHMTCFSLNKIYGILGSLLVSGLVIVEIC